MSPRVVWLVVDAAASWVVQRLLDEGALPAFGRIKRSGVFAAARPPAPNAQTPPGLATLFTGSAPDDHGVTGFAVPDPRRGMLAVRSAFDRACLRRPLVWERLGAHGRATALSHVPWAVDARGVAPGCRLALHGFGRRIARGGVVELSGARVDVPVGGIEARAVRNGDDVSLTSAAAAAVTLTAAVGGWMRWAPTTEVPLLVRAVRRPADGRLLLLFTGSWEQAHGPGAAAARVAKECGPVIGEGLGRAYRAGALGPRLAEGGDGSAEALFLDSVRQAAGYFAGSGRRVLEASADVDLVVVYQPCIDDVEHELIGWCDADSPAHRPDIADRVWPLLARAYRWADEQLAAILAAVGPDAAIVVSSDHGMAGVTHELHVNEVLAAAGLLELGDDRQPVPGRSAIACSPAANGSLLVNERSLPGGIVDSADRGLVLEAARHALLDRSVSVAGRTAVHDVVLRRPGDANGDATVALARGFHLSTERGPGGAFVTAHAKSGSHLSNIGQPALEGIFAATGHGVATLGDVGSIDNRDVASFVAKLAGLGAAVEVAEPLRYALTEATVVA